MKSRCDIQQRSPADLVWKNWNTTETQQIPQDAKGLISTVSTKVTTQDKHKTHRFNKAKWTCFSRLKIQLFRSEQIFKNSTNIWRFLIKMHLQRNKMIKILSLCFLGKKNPSRLFFFLNMSKNICQWGKNNNIVSLWIKIIFLTPLEDICSCFEQKFDIIY